MRTPSLQPSLQRGLSMIELMIGIALALFIAAAGATLLAGNLRESRGLLLEARLMQDQRSAADVIARDLRRAGFWGAAADGIAQPGAPAASNPYAAVAPGSAASDAASFSYSRDVVENNLVDGNEQFGFRLRAGVIEMQLGATNWQALTDAGTLVVTEFSVTPTLQEISLERLCPSPCAAGSTSCPPRQQLRSLALVIGGRLVGDASVRRSVRSAIRVRNDALIGACEV